MCAVISSMVWFHIFALQIWVTTAAEILYVLPDDPTNVTCPSQPCATLSQYWSDNGTLPVVSNVEYHFLPGEHCVPANMTLRNLRNFSIIGIVSKDSLQLPLLIGSFNTYVIDIINSDYVTIANVMFKQHYQPNFNEYKKFTNLELNWCKSCTVENVIFKNVGLQATSLIGNSYLIKIVIKLDRVKSNLLVLCQGISLTYLEWQPFTDGKHLLLMNQITIRGGGTGNECYKNNPVGIYIMIGAIDNLTIVINNSVFYKLDHSAVSIYSRCYGVNTINFENCTFEGNSFVAKYSWVIPRPLVDISLAHQNKTVLFKRCNFKSNSHDQYLVTVRVKSAKRCKGCKETQCFNFNTNMSFEECHSTDNVGGLIKITGAIYHRANVLITGPSQFNYTIRSNLMDISYMNVFISGPVTIYMSFNYAGNVIAFYSCNVLFANKIVFKLNTVWSIIYLESTYIEVLQYTSITLVENIYSKELIEIKDNLLYPFCVFQFTTLTDMTNASPTNYSINILDNVYYNRKVPTDDGNCSFPFYSFTTHCKWIPTAVFYDQNPKIIYQQIIKMNNQNFTYHKICHCTQNGSNNCSVDTLGPVYPGQILQVDLCTPCNDEPSTLYAEVNSIHLPDTACKVAPQTDKANIISNYSKQFNFTIISEATNSCELFLTASSYLHSINEVFYVQLLPCPIGFTLQSGACDCDPILSPYIDECNIDYSAVIRPASTWITAVHINNTEYLISDCPMDYCLPYFLDVNLLHPDLQCRFSRTGILCSQCQHPLSMVFGSSRCMECTNVHILITVIIIVAGIVLVVSLYLLNLTVTKGTINGIIFYANIISINDSVFLVNDNVFKPLRVFISFLNLDLGIETCFYSGMDSYAKMWLQLIFPFYLIIIAALIIIASRYSSKILRLTITRSLPVLATLFLLSYTGVLRTVSTVLFSYSTITYIPGGHRQTVWSIDASVPLFGLKFTILFITCLVLFLLLISFNIILLFTRYLLQFRIINRFKPLLDAFQGSYKDRYYYWGAIHISLRSLFFSLYGVTKSQRLIASTMILTVSSIFYACNYPYKNKLVNIQELLLLLNLTIMYAVSYQCSESVFSIVTNVMISLAFIQFCILVLYHFLTYTCHFNAVITLQTAKEKIMQYCSRNNERRNSYIEFIDVLRYHQY